MKQFCQILLATLLFGSVRVEAKAPDQVEDIVFLSAKRPYLIRFHVRIDGKSQQEVWRAFFKAYVHVLDTNRDGKLNDNERSNVLPRTALFPTPTPWNRTFGLPRIDLLQKRLDADQLEEHFYLQRVSPLMVMDPNAPQDRRFANPGGPLTFPKPVNQNLIQLLDRNRNGRVSLEELRLAEQSLMKRDFSDDELLTVDELIGAPFPFWGMFPIRPYSGLAPVQQPRVLVRSECESGEYLANRLSAKYAPMQGPAIPLSRDLIRISEKEFRKLDQNKDKALGHEELKRFWSLAPFVELEVNLGAKPGIKIIRGPKKMLTSQAGQVVLDLGDLQMDFVCPRERKPHPPLDSAALMKQLDRDGNGYLDTNEATNHALVINGFVHADRDNDGKLFLKELTAYRDRFLNSQMQSWRATAVLNLEGEQDGVFGLLDTNRDDNLSIREIRQLPTLQKRLDRNGDNAVTLKELPPRIQFRFALGSEYVRGQSPIPVALQSTKTLAALPRWFQKMDTNRDGDVSRREFFGTGKVFEKIDRDHDALISSGEAKRAEATFRRAK